MTISLKQTISAAILFLACTSVALADASASMPSAQPTKPTEPTPVALPGKFQSLLGISRSEFQPVKDRPGQFYYLKPGADLLQYSQIMVAPLVILNSEDGKQWQALISDQSGQAAQLFQQTISKALQDRGLKITNQVGPGVILLRVAVTHIEQNTKGFTISDVLPIKMIFNLARSAVGLQKYIVKMSTISQLEDSQSGELIAGNIGVRKQDKSGSAGVSINDYKKWLESWSQDVADRMASALPSARQ